MNGYTIGMYDSYSENFNVINNNCKHNYNRYHYNNKEIFLTYIYIYMYVFLDSLN